MKKLTQCVWESLALPTSDKDATERELSLKSSLEQQQDLGSKKLSPAPRMKVLNTVHQTSAARSLHTLFPLQRKPSSVSLNFGELSSFKKQHPIIRLCPGPSG